MSYPVEQKLATRQVRRLNSRDSAETIRLKSTQMDPSEETLILIKPDALERGLVGEILRRIERTGLRIKNIGYVCPNLEKVETHYADLKARNPRAFDRNTRYLAGKNVIAVVLSGVRAISKIRTLIGATEPAAAQPGTIRGRSEFGHHRSCRCRGSRSVQSGSCRRFSGFGQKRD